MSQCECVNAGEPRDIIDLYTPLYQACGGRLYRLHVTEDAKAVLMTDGVNVETRINSLERALLANTTTYFADDIAHRDQVGPLTAGDRCYVFDASADATVPYGSAMYIWLPSRKWHKLYNGDSPIDVLNLIATGGGLMASNNKLSVKLLDLVAAGKGLGVESGKLTVNLADLIAAGKGLQVNAGKLEVRAADLIETGRALDASTGKLVVKTSELAGAGLKVDSQGMLAVQASSISATELAELVGRMIKANGGLSQEGGKLSVDFGSIPAADLGSLAGGLVKPGAGLAVGTDGKLSVDFASMPAATLKPMVLAMILSGGGLMVDNNGRIYFDPESMDTAVFDRMLKALWIPKPLTKNTTVYVNKSHASAADVDDEGRGMSEAKPFKTIQAAINHMCENYNFGSHNVTIKIAAGTYDELLVLPDFTATTGGLILQPAVMGSSRNVIIRNPEGVIGRVIDVRGSKSYYLYELDVQNRLTLANITSSVYPMCLNVTEKATVYLYGMSLAMSVTGAQTASGGYVSGTVLNVNGSCWFYKDQYLPMRLAAPSASFTNGRIYLVIVGGLNGSLVGIRSQTEDATHKVLCSGVCHVVMEVENKGNFGNSGAGTYLFKWEVESGKTLTGKRYNAVNGGSIRTDESGPEYFPGSGAGTVDAATFSWYK